MGYSQGVTLDYLVLIAALPLCIKLGLGSKVVILAFLAATALLQFSRHSRSRTLMLFGACLPLVSACGSGTLLVLGATLPVLVSRNSQGSGRTLWGAPLLAVYATSFLAEFASGFDARTITEVFHIADTPQDAVQTVSAWFRQAPPHWMVSYEALLRAAVFFVLARFFLELDQSRLTRVVSGVLAGCIAAALILGVQIFFSIHSFDPAQQPFWSSLHRYAASFTDPNAFGVFAALSFPVLWVHARERRNLASRAVLIIAVALWAALSLLSGSRSLVLGVILIALFLLFERAREGEIHKRMVTLVIGIGLVAVAGLRVALTMRGYLPVAIERTLDSVSWSTMSDAWFSRAVFLKLALAAWFDNPVTGVGFQNFREAMPYYVQQLQLPIGAWTDNPNNFYLGILAECGVIGGLALTLILVQLVPLSQSFDPRVKSARYSLAALMVLLALGPHLEFDEVNIFAAFLVARAGLEPQAFAWRWPARIAAAVALAVIAVPWTFRSYGLYSLESHAGGSYRWSERRARGVVPCEADGVARIRVRAHPLGPKDVEIHWSDGEGEHYSLPPGELVTLSHRCPVRAAESRVSRAQLFTVSFPTIMVPALLGMGNDPRPLGAQLFFPENSAVSTGSPPPD